MQELVSHDKAGGGIDSLQIFQHCLFGNIGMIVYFTQVCQDEVFQAGMHNLGDDSHSLTIGEMPLIAEDTLLQVPVIRAVAQHLLIVIAFQYNGGAALEMLDQQHGLKSQVCGNSQLPVRGVILFESEVYAVYGIMGRLQWVNDYISQLKRNAGGDELNPVKELSQPVLTSVIRISGNINRDFEQAGYCSHAHNVITMLMSDEDAIEFFFF